MGGARAAVSDGIVYTHSTLGFSVTLPSRWAEQCRISESPDGVAFVNIRNEEAMGDGLLFAIQVHSEEPEISTKYAELFISDGKYIYAVYPGDVTWAYDDPVLSKEYNDMYNAIEGILKTFRYDASTALE